MNCYKLLYLLKDIAGILELSADSSGRAAGGRGTECQTVMEGCGNRGMTCRIFGKRCGEVNLCCGVIGTGIGEARIY